MKHYLWLIVCLMVTANAVAASPKECIEKVNPELAKLLAAKFPSFRIPKLSDLDQQAMNYYLQQGSNGCYIAAIGDFDGDKLQDLAILLSDRDKKTPHLIVALQRGSSWETFELPAFCESIKYCYVEPEQPGTYVRTQAAEDPITRKDERYKLSSKHMSIRSGTLESTGIVYVYSSRHWQYVWVSD